MEKDKLETTTEAISDTMFCYNCVNYNRETQNCNAKNLQMHEKQSCIDYNKTKDINLTKEEIDEVNRILNADDSVYDYTGSLEEILEGHPILFESAEGINGDMVYILKDGSKEIHKIK